MDTLWKIAGIAAAGFLLTSLIRKDTPEIAAALSLFVVIAVVTAGADAFRSVKTFADGLIGQAGLSGEIAAPIWKTCAIAIITKITAELCRDAKENAVASGVETAGAVLGLYAVLPLFASLLELMNRLI